MRILAWLSLALLVDCKSSQPGCTLENCRLMIDACRVEFSGGPDSIAECTGIDRPPRPIAPELHQYCVDACNASAGRGELASCIASKADACRVARDAGIFTDMAYASCLNQSPGGMPVASCAETCRTEQKACDTRCSGGDACDQCLRQGGPNCASRCSDAGWKACLDCSAQCGLDSIACSDRCPHEP